MESFLYASGDADEYELSRPFGRGEVRDSRSCRAVKPDSLKTKTAKHVLGNQWWEAGVHVSGGVMAVGAGHSRRTCPKLTAPLVS